MRTRTRSWPSQPLHASTSQHVLLWIRNLIATKTPQRGVKADKAPMAFRLMELAGADTSSRGMTVSKGGQSQGKGGAEACTAVAVAVAVAVAKVGATGILAVAAAVAAIHLMMSTDTAITGAGALGRRVINRPAGAAMVEAVTVLEASARAWV